MPSYSIYVGSHEDGLLATAIANGSHDNESQAIQYAIRQTYGDTNNE